MKNYGKYICLHKVCRNDEDVVKIRFISGYKVIDTLTVPVIEELEDFLGWDFNLKSKGDKSIILKKYDGNEYQMVFSIKGRIVLKLKMIGVRGFLNRRFSL